MSAPVVILLALAAVLVWIFAGGRGSPRRRHRSPDVDDEELAEAEEDLRQLDAGVTPDEADEELDDWGPGAPK
jgi:hypothetical protein